ncbi:hypothetical protein FQN50_001298 [Emmonsiellopsis sp. PD_5]|nr:hypothetical protein FQN50_001298 [Emmonsiellopsis sp. PD_5]
MHTLTSTALFGLLFFLFATINPAAAQNDKTSTKCAAQNILDACLKSTKLTLDNCPVNDWECLCARYTDVLTCYNNCPSDSGKFAIQSSQVANCNAAKQYAKPTTTTTSTSPATGTATGASGTETETDKPSSGGDGEGDGDGEAVPTETAAASKTVSGAAASGTADSAAVAVVGRGVGMGMGGVVGLVGVGLGMGMGLLV